MIHWTLTFKTSDGRTAVASIYDDTYGTSPVELTGTAEPFTTSLDDSDDLFTPVRRSTGYLRIVDDGTPELGSIIPTGAKERKVTLAVDGTLMWQGWLKAESYKSAWDYMPTIEIPMTSGLGVLDLMTLPQSNVTLSNGTTLTPTYGSVRIARLILECIHLMGTTVSTIVFPATIDTEDGWGALGYRISRYNYFSRNTDTNYDDEDWLPLEAKTALEVLEDICKFFGWTAEEWHESLYFTEVGATDYAAVTYADLIAYATEASTPTPSPATVPDAIALNGGYTLAGARNTVEHLQPAKKVTMEASSTSVGDVISIAARDLVMTSYSYTDFAIWHSVSKRYASKTPLIELHLYEWDGSSWSEYMGDSTRNDFAGAYVGEFDFHLMEETPLPRNWELSLGIYLQKVGRANGSGPWVSPTEQQAEDMPAIVLKGVGMANFSDGYLCISASAKSAKMSSGDGTHSGYGPVKAQLRIGGRYWTGVNNEWSDTPSYFDISVVSTDEDDPSKADGDGQVVNTKTLLADCEPCRGQLVKISEVMTGDVILTIPTLVQTVSGTSGNYDRLQLSDFKITYHPPYSKYYEEGDTRSYTTFTGADGDPVEVKASIASDKNTRPGYGLLMDSTNTPVQTVTYTDEEEERPELRLINRMAAHYAQVRDKITVDVEPYQASGALVPNTDNPLTVVTYGGKDFAIIGRTVNWRDWMQTLTLLEI